MKFAVLSLSLALVLGVSARTTAAQGPPFIQFNLYDYDTGEVVGAVSVVRPEAGTLLVDVHLQDGVPNTIYRTDIAVPDALRNETFRPETNANGSFHLRVRIEIPEERVSLARAIIVLGAGGGQGFITDEVGLPPSPGQ